MARGARVETKSGEKSVSMCFGDWRPYVVIKGKGFKTLAFTCSLTTLGMLGQAVPILLTEFFTPRWRWKKAVPREKRDEAIRCFPQWITEQGTTPEFRRGIAELRMK